MSGKNFLENLKNAVEEGDFNSEAARKINKISELAENKGAGKRVEELEEVVEKRLEEAGVVEVPEEDLPGLKENQMTEYEEKMQEFKERDKVNSEIAILHNINNVLTNTMTDLGNTIALLGKKYEGESKKWTDLFNLMDELTEKYNLKENVNEKD
jgi:hypothetical protein